MKLEASLVGESEVRMNLIQVHLANLTLQLQDIKKAKEDRMIFGAPVSMQTDIPRIPVRCFRIICYQEPRIC